MITEIKPYNNNTKKKEIQKMFDNISKSYDVLNKILSFGIDKSWRNRVFKIAQKEKPENILDIATGTGDLAIKLSSLAKVTGLDISEGMLEIARTKIHNKGLSERIQLQWGDAEKLPFDEASFDMVTVAFGVRNFENLEKGITQINRVLKSGGKVIILEFSQPENRIISFIYNIYSKYLIPLTGGIISKDEKAYKYLDKSSRKFISGEKFLQLLATTGFKNNKCKSLTFGISSIYIGEKV